MILGLADYDLADVFRAVNGYSASDAGWLARRGETEWRRRADHIFASRRLRETSGRYLHAWRERRLSDHSAIEADFAG